MAIADPHTGFAITSWRLASLSAKYAAVTAPVFALWEWAHLPLYTLWKDEGPAASYWAAAHCTLGDAILAFATGWLVFLACAAVPAWRNATAAAIGLVVAGVAATVVLEYVSTQWLSRWAYSAAMPQLFGIGLSPLVQWSVTPILGAFMLRRRVGAAWGRSVVEGRHT